MDVSPLLAPLNEAQREAVTAPLAPTLVLAGAGSGKTRVLTHRIAWLIQVEGVSPHGILAVTFTNKAAGEMRGRVETAARHAGPRAVDRHVPRHRAPAAAPALARGGAAAELPDPRLRGSAAPDQEARQGAGARRGALGAARDAVVHQRATRTRACGPKHAEGRRRSDAAPAASGSTRTTRSRASAPAWSISPSCCCARYELWRDNPALLAHYRRRFRHVLVDEFQDTNAIQYAWMKLLVGRRRRCRSSSATTTSRSTAGAARASRTCSSSGATSRARSCIRLEQNYRSTGNILEAANALIAQQHRPPRQEAVDQRRAGEPIQLYAAFNERDEAEFVIEPHPRMDRARAAQRRESRSCIARTRSRACSKKRSSRRAFRTACTAACGSSSAPKSRMRWPTCA